MNGEDQFEQKLQSQPQRPVPPSWRKEILNTARAAAAPGRAVPASPGSTRLQGSGWYALLLKLFWPHPKAWAGLAAIWLLILGFNLASREPSQPERTHEAGLPSPQIRQLLLQQEQLLAELVGPADKSEATPPKSSRPGPRSQRREEFFHV